MLRKYLPDPSHVIELQEIHQDGSLSCEEVPVALMDRQVKKLWTKNIPSVKVLWRHHSHEEITWEAEDEMRAKHP